MKQKEFDILLDIRKPNKTDIEVVQDDINTNVFNISIIDGLEPFDLSGCDIDIVFLKSDKTTVVQSSTSDPPGVGIVNETQGKIQCILYTNTIACPGPVIAEVKINEAGALLTTGRFEFFVRESLINEKTLESTNEFPILKQLVEEVSGIVENMPVIEGKLNEIEDANSELNQTIQTGQTLKTELEGSITDAYTAKAALDNSITTGNDLKDELHEIIAGTDYEEVLQMLDDKLDKADIIQSDAVSIADKVPSSVVTAAHRQELDNLASLLASLNNNLAKMPFTCTALSGYTIASSNCFVQNKIAYINLRIEKIDGSSFSSDIQDIATVPHMPVSAVTALCAIGLSAGGVMQTIERCGIFAYSRGITIKPASTDTKSVYLTGTYEINI